MLKSLVVNRYEIQSSFFINKVSFSYLTEADSSWLSFQKKSSLIDSVVFVLVHETLEI
jgi:hypothetical protein